MRNTPPSAGRYPNRLQMVPAELRVVKRRDRVIAAYEADSGSWPVFSFQRKQQRAVLPGLDDQWNSSKDSGIAFDGLSRILKEPVRSNP